MPIGPLHGIHQNDHELRNFLESQCLHGFTRTEAEVLCGGPGGAEGWFQTEEQNQGHNLWLSLLMIHHSYDDASCTSSPP